MDQPDPSPLDDDIVERIAALVDALPHLVGITDDRGTVLWLNRAGRSFLGVDRDQSLRTVDLFTDEMFGRYYAEIRPEVLAGRPWTGSLSVRRPDGTSAAVDAVIVGGAGAGGEVRWLAALAIDVTRQREREADLAHRASHDPLTGLPNRALATDRLRMAMAVATRTGAPIAAIALDLDGFKGINDRLGHAAGDLVLQQVTARLTAAVRPADTVARFGGDEFVVIIHPPESTHAAVLVAQRIRDQLASPAYVVGDEEVHLSASIGLTVTDPSDGIDEATLLSAADHGMYRAKRAGGNCIRVTSTTEAGELDELESFGHLLAAALSQGQIEAGFEPVRDARTQRVLSLRARARWRHPTRGLLADVDFLDDAQVTGYRDLVWWAATRAAVAAATRAGIQVPLDLHVPVSVLSQSDVVEHFSALRHSGARVAIRIAVSERSLVEIPGTVIDIVDAFRSVDIGFVLTDHGTGGVPLVILAELPLDAVELDPSITADARSQPNVVALASQLAAAHHVPCVAADVEREPDRDFLAVLGVDAVRGPVNGEVLDEAGLVALATAQTDEKSVTRPRI